MIGLGCDVVGDERVQHRPIDEIRLGVRVLRRIDQLDRLIDREAQRVMRLVGMGRAAQRDHARARGGESGGNYPHHHVVILPVVLCCARDSGSAHALIACRSIFLETERIIRPHIDVGKEAAGAGRRTPVDRMRESRILRATGERRSDEAARTSLRIEASLSTSAFSSSFPRKRESRASIHHFPGRPALAVRANPKGTAAKSGRGWSVRGGDEDEGALALSHPK